MPLMKHILVFLSLCIMTRVAHVVPTCTELDQRCSTVISQLNSLTLTKLTLHYCELDTNLGLTLTSCHSLITLHYCELDTNLGLTLTSCHSLTTLHYCELDTNLGLTLTSCHSLTTFCIRMQRCRWLVSHCCTHRYQ